MQNVLFVLVFDLLQSTRFVSTETVSNFLTYIFNLRLAFTETTQKLFGTKKLFDPLNYFPFKIQCYIGNLRIF